MVGLEMQPEKFLLLGDAGAVLNLNRPQGRIRDPQIV